MDNLKSSHDTYEATLKDKILSLQKEKEKLSLEFIELNNINKQKRK